MNIKDNPGKENGACLELGVIQIMYVPTAAILCRESTILLMHVYILMNKILHHILLDLLSI